MTSLACNGIAFGQEFTSPFTQLSEFSVTKIFTSVKRRILVVLTRGFEPPRVSPCAPEAHASASFAT